jgi:hypothetical protein
MIGRIANAFGALDALSCFLSVVVGVGCIGYVVVTWAIHLVNTGQYFVATASALVVLTVSAFAAVRVPIALWLFFGSAALLGTAFLIGAGSVVLP